MKYLHLVLLYSWATTATARTRVDPTNAVPTGRVTGSASLVHVPLVPHHVQRNRRLSEYDRESFDVETRERPTRYQRNQQHSNIRHGRSLEANQVVELFQGYGTHYADLWVGTPPQRQTVIVDTGSGVTAFPCSACVDCGVPKYHADALFVEADSSSFEKLSCDQCLRGHCSGGECKLSMSYQEGSSWFAYEALDTCYVGGLHNTGLTPQNSGDVSADDLDPFHAPDFSFALKFGCQTRLTGLFISQLADGIMGMDNADSSYWKQGHKAGLFKKQSFSLCYSRQDVIDRKGTESGSMTLGGTDPRVHSTTMIYTRVGSGGMSGFYAVTVRQMYLREGGSGNSAKSSNPKKKIQSLELGDDVWRHGRVIVDSGTTDTYFTRQIAGPFAKVFKQLSGKDYGHSKQKLTPAEVDELPTILIQLVGDAEMNKKVETQQQDGEYVIGLARDIDPKHPFDVILAIPPSHYMEYEPDEDKWTARFYTDEGSGGVIGGNAMMGHDVFFDIDNERLGWAEADCDYSSLMNQYDFEGDGASSTASKKKKADANTNETESDVSDSSDESVLPIQVTCSSLTCQGSLLIGLLVVVVIITTSLLRRGNNREGVAYAVAQAELELQETNEENGAGRESQYHDVPNKLIT